MTDPAGHEVGRGPLARRILPGGEEPDPRFTLANERTFLAWIRTALAFLAGAVALEAFAADAFDTTLRQAVALSLVVLSIGLTIGAAWRWVRIESSMRHRRPLPFPALGIAIALAVVAAAAALVWAATGR